MHYKNIARALACLTLLACASSLMAFQSPPSKAPPAEALVGKWKNNVDGSTIEIRKLYDTKYDTKVVVVGKNSREWRGAYKDGTLKATFKPKPGEMNPAAPDWARKRSTVDGKLTWELELKLELAADDYSLRGMLYPGEIQWKSSKDLDSGDTTLQEASVTGAKGRAIPLSYVGAQPNCGLDVSQSRDYTNEQDGKQYVALSFFEPGPRIAVGRITDDDAKELAKEVARLKANKCYEVCIRSLVTAKAIGQALDKCDRVYILVHGSKTAPYISPGGGPDGNLKQFPQTVNAGSVWIGACYGEQTVTRLNGSSGSRYATLPKGQFETDGTATQHNMVQGLIAELKKLQAEKCDKPVHICILSGVQTVEGK